MEEVVEEDTRDPSQPRSYPLFREYATACGVDLTTLSEDELDKQVSSDCGWILRAL